jgi:hypothetical protein
LEPNAIVSIMLFFMSCNFEDPKFNSIILVFL